jgi:S1-C subfamily serine protease
MNRISIATCLSAFVLFVLATAGNAFAGWSIDDMNTQIDQTNFIVNAGCSGTLINLRNHYILTASHCVNVQYESYDRETVAEDGTIKTEKVRRVKPGAVKQVLFDASLDVRETTYRTKLIAVDTTRDLAVVQTVSLLPNTRAAKLECVDNKERRGSVVFIVGNPLGLYSSVVQGIVSSTQRSYELLQFGTDDVQTQPLMQVSGGVVGGNSGGAVYNQDGNLIGVSVLAHKVNEVLGFAVPLDVIKAFLKDKKLDGIFSYCDQIEKR